MPTAVPPLSPSSTASTSCISLSCESPCCTHPAAVRITDRYGAHVLLCSWHWDGIQVGDLPQLYSHFGSRGIVPITILQSYPQGVGVWGESGMKALFGAATIKVIGSGTDDPSFAEDISRLVGDADVDMVSVSSGADGKRSRSRSVQQRRILSAAEIRALPKGRVIVLSTGSKPALLHSAPWYTGTRKDEIAAALARGNGEIEAAALQGRRASIPDPAWLGAGALDGVAGAAPAAAS
ncbi:TraM-binding TraD/TraG-like protein [Motilibacter rhizosphaerae]|uniref:TraM-binding TraD/TraG-like protein n=1 Tax=Motilibacter rhizosphaerae TaxID=598652 RepID=A0A4Q7NWJ9_9ACTN|nr:TraG/TraD/VirD4 family protein [Motilibacter rhizosphaerae]RZS91595.1 TraM-binding TraD/TraG-like protein [Motilibacter rhizosphaerae]